MELSSKISHVILASDGLWDVVQMDEIKGLINGMNPKDAAEKLVRTAIEQ